MNRQAAKGARLQEPEADAWAQAVAGRPVVEAVDSPLPMHVAQVISYLKTTRQRLGLFINFKVSFLQKGLKRVILTQ